MFKSKDGFVLIKQSNHMEQHKSAVPFLAEAIGKIDFRPYYDMVVVGVDMGRIVGVTTCVQTRPDDVIVFERRYNRRGKTRFVKGRTPEPSRYVTIIASKRTKTLVTAYIGTPSPREPWDNFESEGDWYNAVAFWENHALIYELEASTIAALADR